MGWAMLSRGARRLARLGTMAGPALLLAALLAGTLAACDTGEPVEPAGPVEREEPEEPGHSDPPEEPPLLGEPRIVETLPHDSKAYTQGLLLYQGRLYESTGLYGESTLREAVPETGEVLRRVELSSDFFGEGLARVGSRLVQLTWRAGRAFAYDVETFELLETLTYAGEGWGLCYDGTALVQTRGDATLTRRDPETFAILETVHVTRDEGPVGELNELECVGGEVWANVYRTKRILRIDGETGRVLQTFDFTGILPPADAEGSFAGVMNGIAHDPGTDTFLLTGKLWSAIYRVRFGDD